MDVSKILHYALMREKEGLAFFMQKAEKAGHASVKGIFERLAEEERNHISFIEHLIHKLDHETGVKDKDLADFMADGVGVFASRAVSEAIEQTTLEAMVPDLPVLRMAYLIERDLADFYKSAALSAEGQARSALEMLSGWESEHEKLFKSLHDKLMDVYAKMPWGG